MSDAPIHPTPSPLLPWIAAVGFFMATLDTSVVNVAIPAMAHALGANPLDMHLVVVAYLLTIALLIPASGWLADRLGTRRVYLSGIAIFTLASLFCALSGSLTQLVLARILQGIGGAVLQPVGRLAMLKAYPPSERLRVLSFVAMAGLMGPLIGPSLGGWLVGSLGWEWIFLINLPVGLAGYMLALYFMPSLPGHRLPPFDWLGYLLFGAGMLLFSFALQRWEDSARQGSQSLALLACIAGLVCLASYWLHARRRFAPLFSTRLFRLPTFTIGILGNLFSRLGSGAMPFLTPLFLQVGLGYSPLHTGTLMICTVLGGMISKAYVVWLIERWGYRRVLVGNTVAVGCVMVSHAMLVGDPSTVQVVITLSLFGLFNSVQFSAMNTLTLLDLSPRQAASGNSLLSVIQQVSMSFGVAIAAMLLATFNPGELAHLSPHTQAAFRYTYLTVGTLTLLSTLVYWQLENGVCPPHDTPDT